MNTAIEILSKQGYVPETCLLQEPIAFPLIMSEITAGKSPCDGCNLDRNICKGSPKNEKQ